MRRLLVALIVFLGAVVVAGVVVAASPPARNYNGDMAAIPAVFPLFRLTE